MDEELNDDTAADVVEDETPEVESDAPAEEPEQDDQFNLERAQDKIRKANSENRNLRKRAAEAEEKAKAAEGSTERVTALEAENMRLKVAVKLNGALPDDLVERLRGATEEEMLEDAEKLLAHFESRKPPTNQPRQKLRGGGDPTVETSLIDSDPDKFAESIFKN